MQYQPGFPIALPSRYFAYLTNKIEKFYRQKAKAVPIFYDRCWADFYLIERAFEIVEVLEYQCIVFLGEESFFFEFFKYSWDGFSGSSRDIG